MTTKTTLGVVSPEVLNRENHTGEQPIVSITNLQDSLDQKAEIGGLPYFLPRAWVRFSGVGGISIAGQGNVASVVKNATGHYTITLSTPMPSSNYAVLASGGTGAENRGISPTIISPSTFDIRTFASSSGALLDFSQVFAIVVGD